jgi:serine/threonine-protein kinase
MLTQVGKYQILEKIGVGGFGSVYRGRDPFIKRSVAIKTCQGDDDEIRKRFFREAEYAGNLHHPNITTIYDFGVTDDGIPYIVQEFLTGEDLDKKIKRQEQIPLLDKIRILRDVAEGLGYAHNAGIIHRDVKPSNIRILEDGTVKIMDFGIAKSMVSESTLTQTGITLGTASYLAPEQIRGEPVDQRTDLFSLGVLAYELFALQKPFTGDHISTVLYKILHESPVHPIEAAPGIPTSLALLILSTLEKDREKRPASCAEVREQLYWISREISGRSPGEGSSRTERMEIDPSASIRQMPAPQTSGPAARPDSQGSLSASHSTTVSSARPEQLSPSPAFGPDPGPSMAVSDVPLRKDGTIPGLVLPEPSGPSRAPLRIFLASLALLGAMTLAGWYFFAGPGARPAVSGGAGAPTATPPPGGPAALPSPAPGTSTAPAAAGTAAPPSSAPQPTVPASATESAPTAVPSPTAVASPPVTIRETAGKAFFHSNIYAILTVDGKDRGGVRPAGLRLEAIPAGRHRAVFAVADFMSIEREFEVKGGQTTDVRAEFPARGQLQVAVNVEAKGAEVFVDGKAVGPAPLRKSVAAGLHRIEIRHPAFEPETREVVVPEEDMVKVPFELRKKLP